MNARAWLAPVALLGLLALALVASDPARWLSSPAPPTEEIVFERVILEAGHIEVLVRNLGATETTIAQVLVDDAYWTFEAQHSGPLPRFARDSLSLDYPWVETEPITITLLTGTGVKFEHVIDVAVESPQAGDTAQLGGVALVGIVIGVLPVLAGMAFLPLLRSAGTKIVHVVLALTLGLLAFLLVDTMSEGLEMARELPGAYHATTLFAGAAIVALVSVLAIDAALKRRGAGASALAILVAVGIGLHNMGEGLVVGSAFAVGSLALGSTLVVGFAIHNVTEGPAVVAPLLRGGTVSWKRFALLAAIAGLPTILGAWLGAFASGGVLPVVFFGLGTGAILVVLWQVGHAMSKDENKLATPSNLIAFAAGFLIMLATSFLVAA